MYGILGFQHSILHMLTANVVPQPHFVTKMQTSHVFRGYEQGATVPSVIDAVYTFAHALQNFLTENCENPHYGIMVITHVGAKRGN